MATSLKAAYQTMQSHLMAAGWAENVVIGEPRREMQSGTVAVVPMGGEIDETTLGYPREIHRCDMRLYRNWLEEDQEETEFVLDQFLTDVLEDVFGDFELGGNVAYALPVDTAWDYDEPVIDNVRYRAINITIAFRVDTRFAFSP